MSHRQQASMAMLQQMLGLLLLLGLLVTATAAEQQCPTLPQLSPDTIKCEVLIVGGGAGGLFAAFMLRDLGSKVCLVEKQPYFGGKLQVIGPGRPVGSSANGSSNPYGVIGTAGMRIDETQTELRCLAQQLGVKADSSENSLLLNVKDRWVRGDADPLLLPPAGSPSGKPTFTLTAPGSKDPIPLKDRAGMYEKLWDYLILGKTNVNPLTGQKGPSPAKSCGRFQSVGAYITKIAGREALRFLLVGKAERSELLDPIDVCAYLEYARIEDEREDVQYVPRGGFKELLDRVKAQASTRGVRFYAGSQITCLYGAGPEAGSGSKSAAKSATTQANNAKKSDMYIAGTADGKQFVAPRLIFASGPLDVKKLGGSLATSLQRRAELQAIWPVEMAVYNAFYPHRFWERYSAIMYGDQQILTTEQCTVFSEFPGWALQRTVNASRPVYASDPNCVTYWKRTLAEGGPSAIRDRVGKSLRALFPQETIPQPTLDHFQVMPDAWHHLAAGSTARGITSASLSKWASAPLGGRSLCLVGEAYYPLYSGWTQGAWASAYSCVSSNFNTMLSKASQAANAFINDGCGGADEFENEVDVPVRKLPGQSPDGKGNSKATIVTEAGSTPRRNGATKKP